MVRHHYKLAAFFLVAAMVLIAAVAYGMFRGTFKATVPVTVTSARAGLVMDPGAKVKMRGVQVGQVASVDLSGSQALITLEMDPDKLSLIPANSTVDIKSTTVFGAKFVSFTPPATPSAAHLASGANVVSQNVTVEFNTVFQNLSNVLQAVQPEKLNAALGAIADALRGRGNQLGQSLEQANTVLTQLNPSVPALQNDLQKAAVVTNTYGDAAPALLNTLDNLTHTSGTIVDQQANLDKLLLDVTGLATTGTDVLGTNQPALATTLSLLRPTSALLYKYSPEFSCFFKGLNFGRVLGEQIAGGIHPWIGVDTAFLPGGPIYSYPQNLPIVGASGGPRCNGLPQLSLDQLPGKYLITNTGVNPIPPGSDVQKPHVPALLDYLHGPLPGGQPSGGQP